MMYFLYNNSATKVIFQDVGLEILAYDYFEINQMLHQFYFNGCSIDVALQNQSLLMTKNNNNNPPNENDIISIFKSKYILSRDDSAFEIHYLDDETNIGANNVQEVIESLNEKKIEEAPINNTLYGRMNGNWIEATGEISVIAEAAGLEQEVQFNSDGDLDASPNFKYEKSYNRLTVSGAFVEKKGEKVGVWVI